ncbi:hypothetical protein B0T16DRAFT_53097 [Cercophora newfieldiana]|uniref:Uncharacterized protein n=1 Tax=Cercophora newfieldiana TaxID=92897 RepID=A0AA39YT20_9PEZI|nr:hypothetical protein B0T16DRAFT_53097 [Cercophora newfieldiana]
MLAVGSPLHAAQETRMGMGGRERASTSALIPPTDTWHRTAPETLRVQALVFRPGNERKLPRQWVDSFRGGQRQLSRHLSIATIPRAPVVLLAELAFLTPSIFSADKRGQVSGLSFWLARVRALPVFFWASAVSLLQRVEKKEGRLPEAARVRPQRLARVQAWNSARLSPPLETRPHRLLLGAMISRGDSGGLPRLYQTVT